jgi:hypothetical protein
MSTDTPSQRCMTGPELSDVSGYKTPGKQVQWVRQHLARRAGAVRPATQEQDDGLSVPAHVISPRQLWTAARSCVRCPWSSQTKTP